jgi:hypothetical protein
MTMLQNANAISAGGYDINNSLRFRSSATANLTRTPASSGDRQKFTISVWIKRGTLSTEQAIITQGSGNRDIVRINPDNTLFFYWYDATLTYSAVSTTQVFRDPSAWYHIVVAVDTTQATSSNRVKLYVNGTQVTALTSTSYPNQNYSFTYWNTTNASAIGKDIVANNAHLDGYMAEFHFIDGSQKAASDFGETDTTTGVWKPAKYTGTYGTNGYYLKFSDIATTSGSNAGLGKDFSGNANYWTTNNISVTAGTTYDAMIDSPTLTSATVANYCTLNPLPYYGGYNVLSQGNLRFTSGNTNWMRAFATIAVSSGKWYWEVTVNNTLSQMHGISNVTNLSYSATAQNWVGFDATGYAYFSDNGTKFNNNGGVTYGATYGAGDVIGIAFDADNGKLYFSKNGTFQASGDPAAGTNAAFTGLTSGPYVPAVSLSTFSGANTCDANFGQRPFSYTPPTGFKRLNTYNLPDSTIKKGNSYFDAVTYNGSNSNLTVTNAGSFQPDLVWAKSRSGAYNNILVDAIRGGNLFLSSNTTNADTTSSGLATFTSSGITWIGGASGVNASGDTYVDWMWKGGNGTSSNTSGSITSTVSVNATAGFSVVTYTGNNTLSTVGHGLGVGPKFIIVKTRSGTDGWIVYHASLGVQYYSFLNTTAASLNNLSNYWGSTAPSSTTFSINAYGGVNTNGATYVAYCWAAIPGFSAFGSYTGNGSADGVFVYTGFVPKFVLIKKTSGADNWLLYDTARDTYNIAGKYLSPNLSNAEGTDPALDMLSNGFKLRQTGGGINGSGATYIYAAFASNPFRNSNAF